jgi:hypothetical protein
MKLTMSTKKISMVLISAAAVVGLTTGAFGAPDTSTMDELKAAGYTCAPGFDSNQQTECYKSGELSYWCKKSGGCTVQTAQGSNKGECNSSKGKGNVENAPNPGTPCP